MSEAQEGQQKHPVTPKASRGSHASGQIPSHRVAEPSTWGREIHLLLTGGTARSHGQGHRCGVAASGACDLRGDTRAPHAFGSMLCCQLHKILTNVPLTWSPTLIFHWVLQISQAVLDTGERDELGTTWV